MFEVENEVTILLDANTKSEWGIEMDFIDESWRVWDVSFIHAGKQGDAKGIKAGTFSLIFLKASGLGEVG